MRFSSQTVRVLRLDLSKRKIRMRTRASLVGTLSHTVFLAVESTSKFPPCLSSSSTEQNLAQAKLHPDPFSQTTPTPLVSPPSKYISTARSSTTSSTSPTTEQPTSMTKTTTSSPTPSSQAAQKTGVFRSGCWSGNSRMRCLLESLRSGGGDTQCGTGRILEGLSI